MGRTTATSDGYPNPFDGDPRGLSDGEAAQGAWEALERWRAGITPEDVLLANRDTDRLKRDKLAYWLWRHHHNGNGRRKVMGQRFWTVGAVNSLRTHWPTIPNRRSGFGDDRLISEHVVPKQVMKRLLVAAASLDEVAALFALNLCAVVSNGEDRLLARSEHPDPFRPWARYRAAGLKLWPNPAWTDAERETLERAGVVTPEASMAP